MYASKLKIKKKTSSVNAWRSLCCCDGRISQTVW